MKMRTRWRPCCGIRAQRSPVTSSLPEQPNERERPMTPDYWRGWNDTAHALLEWAPHSVYDGPMAWARYMMEEVRKMGGRNKNEYLCGTTDCLSYYLRTGQAYRLRSQTAKK